MGRCRQRLHAIRATGAVGLALALCGLVPSAAGAAEPVCDARKVPVRAGLQIAGTYCRPDAGQPTAIFVLVPGATYRREYWDFGHEPGTYSFARATARGGYAVFALDRLGTGATSKPPSATLTATLDAATVHDVIGHLRATGFDGRTFARVLLGGHSLGSTIGILEAATFRDVDGVVVTGLSHRLDPTTVPKVLAVDAYPAVLDPALADRGLDPGYLTTRPGHRYAAFHAPGEVDPAVVAHDEATKDVFSLTEAVDGVGISVLTAYSSRIDVPVLLAIGAADTFFCGPSASDCTSRQAFLAEERPLYAGAPCVDAVVMPRVGHDVNLHPDAPAYQDHVRSWADAVAAGGCPEGL